MTVKIGVIADDFTGATDIAGFMSQQGWRVVLLTGQPQAEMPWNDDADAIVISLKSRSLDPEEAIARSLACYRWLTEQARALQIYFKYCSTFDSTPRGNIGPVSDALMAHSGVPMIVHCPALPQNGRTVVHGHLFVNGTLLNQSGMENHPLNPMKDARLAALLAPQTTGKTGLIDLATIHLGQGAIADRLHALRSAGVNHVIVDTLSEEDLNTLAQALYCLPLLAGGSGLGGALAALRPSAYAPGDDRVPMPPARTVIFSGSCSLMTNRQVNAWKAQGPSHRVDMARCISGDEDYIDTLVAWAVAEPTTPLIYATTSAGELARIQSQYGESVASAAVEALFSRLAVRLLAAGFNTFIVAGGETSGTVVEALQVKKLSVGPAIAPGVPWVYDRERQLSLALKSGNFGDEAFFFRAQELRA